MNKIYKNWFVHKIKKNAIKVNREVLIEKTTIDVKANHPLVAHNSYLQDREKHEFWNHLWNEIEGWEKLKLKEYEKKIIQAIKILFESSDDIEIFNKKAIYLYIREITGLNTKQVVNNLNKIRIKYRDFKTKWDNNEN